jgi:hypothetical protein
MKAGDPRQAGGQILSPIHPQSNAIPRQLADADKLLIHIESKRWHFGRRGKRGRGRR